MARRLADLVLKTTPLFTKINIPQLISTKKTPSLFHTSAKTSISTSTQSGASQYFRSFAMGGTAPDKLFIIELPISKFVVELNPKPFRLLASREKEKEKELLVWKKFKDLIAKPTERTFRFFQTEECIVSVRIISLVSIICSGVMCIIVKVMGFDPIKQGVDSLGEELKDLSTYIKGRDELMEEEIQRLKEELKGIHEKAMAKGMEVKMFMYFTQIKSAKATKEIKEKEIKEEKDI